MNIMFMKEFADGTPTNFREKILAFPFGKDFLSRREMLSLFTTGKLPYNPKLHTMRESFRIKAGMRLDLCNWTDKPYRSKVDKFVKDISCKSTQIVDIKYSNLDRFNSLDVFIDGRKLAGEEISKLAINDGFESVLDFKNHFNKSAVYNLIHWTDLRY